MSLLTTEPLPTKCSRAGCTAIATATVNWRNPKIHTPDRVKVWLACDEHTTYLRDYLEARDFPVVVAPLGVVVTSLHAPDLRATTPGTAS